MGWAKVCPGEHYCTLGWACSYLNAWSKNQVKQLLLEWLFVAMVVEHHMYVYQFGYIRKLRCMMLSWKEQAWCLVHMLFKITFILKAKDKGVVGCAIYLFCWLPSGFTVPPPSFYLDSLLSVWTIEYCPWNNNPYPAHHWRFSLNRNHTVFTTVCKYFSFDDALLFFKWSWHNVIHGNKRSV